MENLPLPRPTFPADGDTLFLAGPGATLAIVETMMVEVLLLTLSLVVSSRQSATPCLRMEGWK